jgi:predicted DNA-binding protein (MmcQ/YjbR family)
VRIAGVASRALVLHPSVSQAARIVAGRNRVEDNQEDDSVDNMTRLERIVARLPEAVRVDIDAWGGEPTFRVRNKNFVFTDQAVSRLSVKLPIGEAAAVVATDVDAQPTGYGLGRHGWVSVAVGEAADDGRWQLVEEWVRTSYTMVAPKTLAKIVIAEDES